MGKITNLLITLIIVGFIFAGLITFLSVSTINAGVVTYDEINNATYNKISDINNLTQEIREKSNVSVEQSTTDILGSYFKQGYSAFRLTLKSGDMVNDMITNAGQETKLSGIDTFIAMLLAIMVILIVLGVIIYVVVGKDV